MPPKKSVAAAATAATTTPKTSMDDLYTNFYKEYTGKYGPRTAILLQVGKFYEMYDSVQAETGVSRANVRELAELCGGAPEPKPTDDPAWNRIFWGFPEHSLWKYERMLVNAGYTVVIVDQVRDGTGDVKDRKVAYVSSPGTYMDLDAGPAAAADRHIVGVIVEPFRDAQGRDWWCLGTAAFDVSTGHSTSTEATVAIVDGKPVMDVLEPFWSVYPPAELIVWVRGSGSGSGAGTAGAPELTDNQIGAWFSGGFRGPIHRRGIAAPTAAITRGIHEFLKRLFRPTAALSIQEYLGLARHPAALEALGMLMTFVEEHNPSYLEKLHNHTLWTPEDEVLLGNTALEQLAMLPAGARANECLMFWLQRTGTAMGRRALRQRLLKPITDISELNARQDRIDALRAHDLTRFFHGIQDLAKLNRRLQLGRGTCVELLALLTSYQRAAVLAEQVVAVGAGVAAPATVVAHLTEMTHVWSADRIRACHTGHELALGPHHPWSRGVQPSLDALEDAWSAVEAEVAALKHDWEGLMGEEDALKCEFREETMFVITTTKRRATNLAAVLKTRRKEELEVITRGTASAATLEHAALRAVNERARRVWQIWTTEARDAWREAWQSWTGSHELVEWLGILDAEHGLARVSEMWGYVRPVYVEAGDDNSGSGVAIHELRHPILERVHTTPYIPHSVALGNLSHEMPEAAGAAAMSGILLYGVNAAGKSSLSKAIGLAVLMAQVGMPVPASAMRLIPYTGLFTRILGNDNIWAGMSSFVVEMTEFRSILRSAGPRTLVLGDELCAGTETVSATAIVAAGIQTLVERGAQFVFATHLHELMNQLSEADLARVRPYHLTVRSDGSAVGKLVYDRQLREGAGSPMYGLEVCRGLDMDAEFLTRALAIRQRLEAVVNVGKTSRYNAGVPVQACHACGSKHKLETHHIIPQAAADAKGRVGKGRRKNDIGNLAILCDSCHDRHHRGELTIRGWVDTSEGRMLDVCRHD